MPTQDVVQLERWIRQKIKAGELDPQQAQLLRIEHQRKSFAQQREQARAEHPNLARASTPFSAVANYGNTTIPGVASTAAAALTAPVTAVSRGVGLRDAFGLNKDLADLALGANRAGQTIGTMAAYFTPTPISKVSQLAAGAAGADKLAKIAANSSNMSRSVALQIVSGAAAGGAATAATELASLPGRALGGESVVDATSESIRRTVQGLAMGAAMGGVVGLARAPLTQDARAAQDLIKRAKASRILKANFEPTPDMLRDPEGAVAGTVDTIGRSVTGRRQLQSWLSDHFYRPLQEWNQRMRARVGATDLADDTAAGAGAVRRLLVGEADDVGLLAARRQEIGQQALASARARRIPIHPEGTIRVNRLMDALDQRAASLKESIPARGGRLGRIMKDTRSVLRGGANVAQLEELRQRLTPIANFDKARAGTPLFSDRDVREAKRLYSAISLAMKKSDGVVKSAMVDMQQVRQAERSLREVVRNANLGDDKQLLDAVFQAANFQRRWATITRQLPQERVQALRGAYLAEFLDSMAVHRGTAIRPKDALGWAALRKNLDGSGKFRREVFDAVLGPSVRAELEDASRVSDLVLRTVGRHEGSQTAGREATMQVFEAGQEMLSTGAMMGANPSMFQIASNKVLGLAGLAALYSGLLNGRIARFLNEMASGAVVTTGSQLAPAVAAAGGPLPALQGIGQLTGEASRNALGPLR